MGVVFTLMLAGALAGLLAWAVTEPFAPPFYPSTEWGRYEVLYALCVGSFIGTAVGAVSGWAQGSRFHFIWGVFTGALVGAFAGVIGLSIGGSLATAIFGHDVFETGDLTLRQVFARILVFTPFGGLVGISLGVATRSFPRAIQGFLGGLLGGAVVGAVFDMIGVSLAPVVLAARGQVVGEVGIFSRGVSAIGMGAAIGLFVGVVERLGRKAWLRLELARNEGKEWVVDKPRTFIGRSERADVPLFGDPYIFPMHACLYKQGNVYTIVDGGTPIGIGVNGIRVQQQALRHGDVINIGSFSLRFLLKKASPVASTPQQEPPPSPRLASPQEGHTPTLLGPPGAPQGTCRLVALNGPLAGSRFDISTIPVIAGRASSQISLAFDESASRQHAEFVWTPQGLRVRDLGSTNGTLVNGRRVAEAILHFGDEVQLGMTRFRVE
ncbi:MAG: FHA domain-containing protein [Candidatus Caldarchaeum sp.]